MAHSSLFYVYFACTVFVFCYLRLVVSVPLPLNSPTDNYEESWPEVAEEDGPSDEVANTVTETPTDREEEREAAFTDEPIESPDDDFSAPIEAPAPADIDGLLTVLDNTIKPGDDAVTDAPVDEEPEEEGYAMESATVALYDDEEVTAATESARLDIDDTTPALSDDDDRWPLLVPSDDITKTFEIHLDGSELVTDDPISDEITNTENDEAAALGVNLSTDSETPSVVETPDESISFFGSVYGQQKTDDQNLSTESSIMSIEVGWGSPEVVSPDIGPFPWLVPKETFPTSGADFPNILTLMGNSMALPSLFPSSHEMDVDLDTTDMQLSLSWKLHGVARTACNAYSSFSQSELAAQLMTMLKSELPLYRWNVYVGGTVPNTLKYTYRGRYKGTCNGNAYFIWFSSGDMAPGNKDESYQD